MDFGVYYGEKRIGELEREQEGLYTRLRFTAPNVILSVSEESQKESQKTCH